MQNKILLAEKNGQRRKSLAGLLTNQDYLVIPVDGTELALDRTTKEQPDLLILTPQADGMTALQLVTFLRGHERYSRLPILFISETLPEQDILSFFDAGIDDHVSYSTPGYEMLARVRALLRRAYTLAKGTRVVEHAGVKLLLDERRLKANGKTHKLPRKEFELLKTLMMNPNKVLSATALYGAIWNYDKDVSTKTLQVHIHALRQKLGHRAGCIETHSGVGYSFSTYETASAAKKRGK